MIAPLMIDLALDPSETRPATDAAQPRTAHRSWGRIALFTVIGLAGTGAFAGAANTYLSGLAGPQRVAIASRQKAADWPDLKDGLPALATGSLPSVPKVREILPPEPAQPPVVEARISPILRSGSAVSPDPGARPPVTAGVAPNAAKPLPVIVDVPVIGPSRQANLVAPARTVPGIPPLAGETVRAKTGSTTFAALPPADTKSATADTASAGNETIKPETAKAKPRIEAHAKPPAASKPVAEKPARKPAAMEASAAPAEAQDEDTEVFGIRVPSFAPAGRKIRESVEALGDAVKGLPERF